MYNLFSLCRPSALNLLKLLLIVECYKRYKTYSFAYKLLREKQGGSVGNAILSL